MTAPHLLVKRCNPSYSLPSGVIRPLWKKYNFRTPLKLQEEGAIQRVGGPRLSGFHPVVPDKGYTNFLAAVNKRCNYYDAGVASHRVVRTSIKLINAIAPTPLPEIKWGEALFEPWIARFGPEKQARMRKSVEDWASQHIGDYSDKELFVKCEALLVQHKPNWAPRVIYKGTDFYNAISGPIFWELMHRLDGAAESMPGPHKVRFAYGRTPQQYVPFLDECRGDFLESDFSANDKKQCSDVLRLEIMLMRRLGCPEWFIRLHFEASRSYKVKNKKHGFQAVLDNQLATGVTDTTFRNCFWNWCILSVFLDKEGSAASRSLILGDDIVARIEGLKRNAAKRYATCATEARMDAKVSRHSRLVDASFLSKCFIPLGEERHTVMPLLGKALGRFNTRANNNDAVTDNAYFASKALSYAYEFRFVPRFRDIFLDRFNHHAPLVAAEKHRFRFIDSAWNWNAQQAGLTLKNIKAKLVVNEDWMARDHDLSTFLFYRYGLSLPEIETVVEHIVLNVEGPDYDGYMLDNLAADFV